MSELFCLEHGHCQTVCHKCYEKEIQKLQADLKIAVEALKLALSQTPSEGKTNADCAFCTMINGEHANNETYKCPQFFMEQALDKIKGK